ncbi:MAG TPA: hypothetical protein PK012_18775, partial [Blastocatellia bacterium]|nr:hypothetical protein [Blastocatellia bacterium]
MFFNRMVTFGGGNIPGTMTKSERRFVCFCKLSTTVTNIYKRIPSSGAKPSTRAGEGFRKIIVSSKKV